MFEEIVESQLIIQFKIREGKIETQLSLMAWHVGRNIIRRVRTSK
jgi:hypothetical protein